MLSIGDLNFISIVWGFAFGFIVGLIVGVKVIAEKIMGLIKDERTNNTSSTAETVETQYQAEEEELTR